MRQLVFLHEEYMLQQRVVAVFLIAWLAVMQPVAVWAQAGPTGPVGLTESTGPTEPIGPQTPIGVQGTIGPNCVGTSCPVESASDGTEISGTNSNTGADSTNTAEATVDNSTTNGVSNTTKDTTTAEVTGSSGNNTQNQNTAAGGVTTGAAGIGVTQVKQDNTATMGGGSGLEVAGYKGDYNGDLNLGFGAGTASLQGADGPTSIQAINDTTGSGSTNTVDITTKTEELNEVQNDGLIQNLLDLKAITGQNEANMNTSDGSITTGDADVAATLVNLLNTTIINGSLWLAVADIFGDLNGNIVLPDLTALAAGLRQSYGGQGGLVDAVNENTGANSTNEIDIKQHGEEETTVTNEADVKTTVNAQAITGQNEALMNTGGGIIETGDAAVAASAVTLANATIEGGNWGLVVVNAVNRWLGFLVGEAGLVRALSQEETIREIEARNSATGENSTNTIAVTDERERTTTVENDATIINEINAAAITGQNEANMNTGQGKIVTGDATVKATTVNVANTTVKDGSLFIAVVNVFGDWLGDLLYGGTSLLAAANPAVQVQAGNTNTGSGSTNNIDVEVSRRKETTVANEAEVATILNAEVDTGSNRTNKNTRGASIRTGEGSLELNARTLANLTGVTLDPLLGLSVEGLNDTTGFESTNKIRARLNDERVVAVDNEANVSTAFGGGANTGKNEANMNTLGGMIVTGDIEASAAIGNIINRVMLALAQGSQREAGVEADLRNQLTGMLSSNSNDVTATYNLLADILNRGVIDNLVDLLLNTGGNTANDNTGPAFISAGESMTSVATGKICVDGRIDNVVNGVTIPSGMSQRLDNNGTVNNKANIQATSGNNQVQNNTGGGTAVASDDGCEKLAEAPEPSSTPPAPEPVADQGGQGSGGGGEAEQLQELKPAVLAAAVSKKQPRINGGAILKRFPVAGGEVSGVWREGKTPLIWPVWLLLSVISLGIAWGFDRRARSATIIPQATL